MTPIAKNIVIKPLEQEEKKGSLYMPDSVREKPVKGLVIAVGDEVAKVQADDTVLYRKWGANEIKDEGVVIVEERDVLAIL